MQRWRAPLAGRMGTLKGHGGRPAYVQWVYVCTDGQQLVIRGGHGRSIRDHTDLHRGACQQADCRGRS